MISAMIPAHDEEKYIEHCVRGLFTHCMDDFVEEVIVVNNASDDGTATILSKLREEFGPALIVLDEPRKGVSFARKRALEHATCEYVASIDSDCRPDAEWCRKAKELLREYPDAVCITGPYCFYDPTPFISFLLRVRRFITSIQLHLETKPRTAVYGGNFIAKRNELIRAGGFNTDIEFWGEDTDVELRLGRLGTIIHDVDFTMPSSVRRLQKGGVVRMWLKANLNRPYQLITKKPLFRNDRHWR